MNKGEHQIFLLRWKVQSRSFVYFFGPPEECVSIFYLCFCMKIVWFIQMIDSHAFRARFRYWLYVCLKLHFHINFMILIHSCNMNDFVSKYFGNFWLHEIETIHQIYTHKKSIQMIFSYVEYHNRFFFR